MKRRARRKLLPDQALFIYSYKILSAHLALLAMGLNSPVNNMKNKWRYNPGSTKRHSKLTVSEWMGIPCKQANNRMTRFTLWRFGCGMTRPSDRGMVVHGN